MVLRMKNFDLFGFHWKMWVLGGGGFTKNQCRGGFPKKGGGAWTVCRFKGGGITRKRVVFLRGVDTPMHTNYDDVAYFEILGFTKAQKSRYLENKTIFFLQIKKFINYTSRATLLQK